MPKARSCRSVLPAILAALLLVLLAASTSAEARPVLDRRERLGESLRGRSIRAFERGDPGATLTILVVGSIHGDEEAGIAVARRLLAGPVPGGVDLWVVPTLNPDGNASGIRGNARGVDLNRNFPFDWEPLPKGRYYSGPRPLSEPESRIARDLIRRIRPDITMWYHQPLGVVDLTGGDLEIERRYAHLVGMRVARVGDRPGSVARWQNHRFPGATAFVVELDPGRLTMAEARRHADAVLELAAPRHRRRAP